jgi:hypothetical protein
VTDLAEHPAPAAAPGTYPVPAGRGRWRLTLHNRTYAATVPASTVIAELSEARNRKLVQAWDSAAVLTFDLDGWRPAARYVSELCTEVIAWRWDDTAGADVPYFRGPITASADAVDAQSHTVTVTATDYLALLMRRLVTGPTPTSLTGDQDLCAQTLVQLATFEATTSAGVSFGAGSYLPLVSYNVNPDGTGRSPSGVSRTMPLQGNAAIGTMLDNLSKLSGGFDYDVAPLSYPPGPRSGATTDMVRIFYPGQGVVRTSALYYPGNVLAFTRQVASADYSNYWRTIGNNQSANQSTAQVYGEALTADASGGQAGAPGLWMGGDQSPDQSDPSGVLLPAWAQGQLNIYSVLMPTYTLTLAPGFYYQGAFNMGDTLPLVVQSGRLKVNTQLRVMGITYEPNDDGDEVVTLTVGRAATSLWKILGNQAADIRALARR